MNGYAVRFWTEDEEYHDLAQMIVTGIERIHPDSVTSDGGGSRAVHRCGWGNTAVNYYEYRGPDW